MERLDQLFHEAHLIDAGSEKEMCKPCQRFLAESAPAVEIVAAGLVAGRQLLLVLTFVAGKAASFP